MADQVLRGLGLALALALALPRLTDGPQTVLGVLGEVLAFSLVGGALLVLGRALPVSWRDRVGGGLMGALPGLAAGLLSVVGLWDGGRLVGITVGIGVFGALTALGASLPDRQRAYGLAAGWTGAVALTWLTLTGTLPLGSLVGVAAWAAGSAWLIGHRGAPLAVVGAALFALTPPLGSGPRPPWSAAPPDVPRPDVLLIVVDSLRADHGAAMQTYQRLAEEGVAFPVAVASAPWTLPAMASVFTGQPVHVHGAGRTGEGRRAGIRPELPTLAERLHQAGYDTAAVLALNPNLDARFGFARGFDWFDMEGDQRGRWALPAGADHVARPLSTHLARLLARNSLPLFRIVNGGPFTDAERVVDRALEVLAARRPDRPLFLALHLMDPHLPYRHVVDAPIDETHRRELFNVHVADLRAGGPWEAPRRQEAVRAAYAHEVHKVDQALMRLLDQLPAAPAGRVIVLTSDHGEELWEHGGIEHGHALWEPVVRVPLVIAGVQAGGRQVAGHEDIVPTVLSAAGLPVDPELPGVDLNGAPRPRPILTQNLLWTSSPDGWAVRDGPWKLISPGDLLFEVSTDPDERRDRSNQAPERVQRLRALAPPPLQPGPAVQEPPREALRALGYLE